MKKIIILIQVLSILGVIFLGAKLRWHNYETVPLPGQSLDEYSYSWVGLSLIKVGLPVGISGMPGYNFYDMRYVNVDRVFQSTARGNPVSINYPWFDHPPFMGLVTGGFASLKGADVFEDTIAGIIRRPVVMMSILTLALVAVFSWINYGYLAALFSTLVYSAMPLAVIQSRMIQAENGMIPLALLSFILISIYIKSERRIFLITSAAIAGISVLFKFSGIFTYLAIVPFLFFHYSAKKDKIYSDLIIFSSVFGSFVSLFFIYGAFYDWKSFVSVFFMNSSRYYGIGPAAINNLLLETRITQDKTMGDAWPLVMWISFFIWSALRPVKTQNSPDRLIILAVVSYLVVYILFGSQPYGWYTIPFWPLLSIIMGRFLSHNIEEPSSLISKFVLLTFPFTYRISRTVDIVIFQTFASKWKYGLAGLLLTFGYLSQSRKSQLSKWIFSIIIFVLLAINVYVHAKYLWSIDVNAWYHVS